MKMFMRYFALQNLENIHTMQYHLAIKRNKLKKKTHKTCDYDTYLSIYCLTFLDPFFFFKQNTSKRCLYLVSLFPQHLCSS